MAKQDPVDVLMLAGWVANQESTNGHVLILSGSVAILSRPVKILRYSAEAWLNTRRPMDMFMSSAKLWSNKSRPMDMFRSSAEV